VGKSMVCSNMAIQYARAGFRVVIIDLDLGAANVHTIFGMRTVPVGLGEFFTTKGSQITAFVTDTDIPNLQIIAGGGFVPELANLPHQQKVKLVRQMKRIEADLVLLDLGAGTSNHVIDFFAMCDAGVVVTTPEPTAIINAYEFLKNIIFRILFRMFRNQPELLQLVKDASVPGASEAENTVERLVSKVAEKNQWAAQNIRDVCQDFDMHLILNQGRKVAEAQLGCKLRMICDRFLNLDLHYAGMVFHNDLVSASVFQMSPVTVAFPDSCTSQVLKRLAIETFSRIAKKMLGEALPDPEEELKQVLARAHCDYQLNLLAKKSTQRERSLSHTDGE